MPSFRAWPPTPQLRTKMGPFSNESTDQHELCPATTPTGAAAREKDCGCRQLGKEVSRRGTPAGPKTVKTALQRDGRPVHPVEGSLLTVYGLLLTCTY